ncbi:MAG TPA: glycogen synthase [Balneolaceae bacterium]|nr:glycogen synthase [Balneolaceae bacterium]|tara:strand:+ start:29508 stop:30944 length:1437 start_codon:yes stop_codon:yes gene_type:complete
MNIIHLSAECYPAAKAGGLGDVVGALPKYLNQMGEHCEVIIPKYQTKWIDSQEYDIVWEANAPLGADYFHYKILKEKNDILGFPLYVVEIPGRFDRPGIYIDPWSGHGYWDEFERSLSFQIAALEYINGREGIPDVIHCHDHQTGLIPFMTSQSYRYSALKEVPTVITVHNAEYHGEHEMGKRFLLPEYDHSQTGLLEWNGKLNSLAAGLKCAWQISTVSQSYMGELAYNSNGLEFMFELEKGKSRGIVNGIDSEVWNPKTDPLVSVNYGLRDLIKGKRANKEILCKQFDLDPDIPTIAFIGRLVKEKGADLLPDLIRSFLYGEEQVNFVLLGTGDPALHAIFEEMDNEHVGYFDATLEYNEQLAHQMYAGADFMLMPSRVEPCGLNQLYAMRYGTIPIVRSVGGLKDTVKDLSEEEGYGIRFDDFTLEAAKNAVSRAISLHSDSKSHKEVMRRIVKLDFSWGSSAKEYIKMYNDIIK